MLQKTLVDASNDYENRFDYLLKILTGISLDHPRTATRNLAKTLALRIGHLMQSGDVDHSSLPVKASVEFIKNLSEENFFER